MRVMAAEVVDRPAVRPDQVTLGVLISQVPRDVVDDAVAVCEVREKRSDGNFRTGWAGSACGPGS